jgi:hypothetical protein|tara:strand:- start:37 stop:189 length:153 start_codon:yes stop_codon:yes gene_type:complete
MRGTLIKKTIQHFIFFWQANFAHGGYGIIVLISFYENNFRDSRFRFEKNK